MTFETYEETEGYPSELYEFRRGASIVYRVTSHDTNIEFQSHTYSTTQIKRGSISQTQDIEKNDVRFSVQRDSQIAANFIQFPTTEIMTLTVWRMHLNDGDNEFSIIWRGRILRGEFRGSEAVMVGEPIFTSMRRPALRRHYQSQCPHVLYGLGCTVNSSSFASSGVITLIVDNQYTATAWNAFGDGYFDGGYGIANNQHYRPIVSSTAAGIITFETPFDDSTLVGLSVIAFPGCKHDLSDCETKFDNILNYGGFPYIPVVNPFGGTVIY